MGADSSGVGGMRLIRGCIDIGRIVDSSTSVRSPRPVGAGKGGCSSSSLASWDMDRK
jgi:hypothetical protein